MLAEEVLLKIGVEAALGPAVTAAVTKVLYRNKQRKKCSSYYTMLLHGPPALQDEVARLGVEEGCWTESFVQTFRKANGYVALERKTPDEIVKDTLEKVATDPSTAADVLTGDVDDALVKAVREANEELLKTTLKK